MLARASASRNEICGILGGEISGDVKRVLCLEWLENIDSDPESSYYADPEQLVRSISKIEGRSMKILGIVHSHPSGPARPSESDEKKVTWFGYSHIILAPREDDQVSSWLWDEDSGKFIREEVLID